MYMLDTIVADGALRSMPSTGHLASMTARQDVAEPTHRHLAARSRSAPGRVTGKLKAAIDAMVDDGLTDSQAAVKVGMTVTAIRLAFNRQHVRQYLRQRRDVLRARESARNIHRALAIRDQDDNRMAALNAIKLLEQLDDEQHGRPSAQMSSPGLVIVIAGAPGATVSASNAAMSSHSGPTIEHDDTEGRNV